MLHKICCDLHGWLTYAFFSDRSRSRCPCFTQLRKRSLGRFRRVSGSVDRRSPRKRGICEGCGSGSMHSHTLLLKKLFERAEAASGDSRTLARHLSARA